MPHNVRICKQLEGKEIVGAAQRLKRTDTASGLWGEIVVFSLGQMCVNCLAVVICVMSLIEIDSPTTYCVCRKYPQKIRYINRNSV